MKVDLNLDLPDLFHHFNPYSTLLGIHEYFWQSNSVSASWYLFIFLSLTHKEIYGYMFLIDVLLHKSNSVTHIVKPQPLYCKQNIIVISVFSFTE